MVNCLKLFYQSFSIQKSDSVEDYKLRNIIKNEFTLYQTEIISKEIYIQDTTKDTSKSCNQSSNWQEVSIVSI